MSKIHALVIGTNYTGTTSALAGCLNDASDWAKLLKPRCASLVKLTGRKASRKGIEKAAIEWRSRLRSGDLGVVTFSGHGTRERDLTDDEQTGYDQAIVCDDFELIYDDEMAGWFARREAGSEVFAFLDCCHSATMHRGAKPRTIPLNRCKRRVDVPDRYGTKLRALSKLVLFSGCGDGPTDYSYDAEFGGRANGAATYMALAALERFRAAPTYRQWFRALAGLLPNEDYPQVPAAHGSRAMLARKALFWDGL